MKSSYSGREIPKGTGFMYVKKDGSALYFVNQKEFCNWQMGRVGKKLKWTKAKKVKKKGAQERKEEAAKEEKKQGE